MSVPRKKTKPADPRFSRAPEDMVPRLHDKLVGASRFAEHLEQRAQLEQYSDKKLQQVAKKVNKYLSKAREAIDPVL
jgi:hypothetical protein